MHPELLEPPAKLPQWIRAYEEGQHNCFGLEGNFVAKKNWKKTLLKGQVQNSRGRKTREGATSLQPSPPHLSKPKSC